MSATATQVHINANAFSNWVKYNKRKNHSTDFAEPSSESSLEPSNINKREKIERIIPVPNLDCLLNCQCDQSLLLSQVHPSVKALIVPGERLKHHHGYIIPECSQFDQLPLSQLYPSPRDKFIVFYDPETNPVHKYVLKGVRVGISCTGFIGEYYPEFDAHTIIKGMIGNPEFPGADRYVKYRTLPIFCTEEQRFTPLELSAQWKAYIQSKDTYKDKLYKIPPPDSPLQTWTAGLVPCANYDLVETLILNQWDANKDDASSQGTDLHESCEYLANNLLDRPQVKDNLSIEFGYCKQFFDDLKLEGWVPYRTEQMIYDEELDLCGSVDLQLQRIEDVGRQATPEHRKQIFLFDHKRSKQIKYNDRNKMFAPFQEFDDCNFNHYTVQLNIYASILEKHYHVDIVDLSLSIFHPTNESYLRIPAPRRKDLISKIFNDRRQLVLNRQ